MTTLAALVWTTMILASIPATMAAMNLFLYRGPRGPRDGRKLPAVSVLIPARNEEATIAGAVGSALRNRGIDLEVVVMDDHSDDATAEIVRSLRRRDARLRLVSAPPLGSGWCGKQHACHALSKEARHPILVFLDADVRLSPDALSRLVATLERTRADLASGVPWQQTETWMEKLVIPMIHFLLLGYLPMIGMRLTRQKGFAAGCGQLFVARREAYDASGGHAAIRSSRHDGLTLPRAFREAGFTTDLFDATDVAGCRMYHGARQVWDGFAKNADEGMASPKAIGIWSVLLFGGQVLPLLLLAWAWATGASEWIVPAAVGTGLGYLTRLVLAWRFKQSLAGALLHPLGVLVVLAIQWYAWVRSLAGRPVAWKGRLAT